MKIRCDDNSIHTAPLVHGLSLNLCFFENKKAVEIFYYTKRNIKSINNFPKNIELFSLLSKYKQNNSLIIKDKKTLISNLNNKKIVDEYIVYSSDSIIKNDLIADNDTTKKYIEEYLYTTDLKFNLSNYATGLVQSEREYGISTNSLLDTSKNIFNELVSENSNKIIIELSDKKNITLQDLIDESQLIEISQSNAYVISEINLFGEDINKILEHDSSQFEFLELLNLIIYIDEFNDILNFSFNNSSLEKVCIEQACADFLSGYEIEKNRSQFIFLYLN